MECEFSLEKEIEGIITNAVVLVSSYWRNVNSDSRTYHGASLVVSNNYLLVFTDIDDLQPTKPIIYLFIYELK